MTSATTDRRYGVTSSMAIKVPCRAATTANVTLSGEQTIDGISCVTGDRVLVKSQTTGADNGIYVVDTGSWSRSVDWDGIYDVRCGTLVYINSGTANAGLFYSVTTADTITIGTTSVALAVVSPSSPITFPTSLANGGTAINAASNAALLSALGVIECTSVGGTANAITCTIGANTTAYRTNQLFLLKPSSTNTSAVTLTPTPSGAGALAGKNVFANGAACVGGELVSGLEYSLIYDGTQLQIIGTNFFRNNAADLVPDKTADFVSTYDASAKLYKRVAMQDFPLPRTAISGLSYANNSGDATNDIDIAAGSCRDSTDAVNIFLTATLTKQSDVAWSVGSGAGGLDTGAVGNSDYYIWLIKRSDTGVVDALYSLSSTAPTMPTSYDYKRIIGWFKRVGATVVAFHTYETEGGGIEMAWDSPTLDVNLANTLTTARRTDAVKVPLNFSVVARLNVIITDSVNNLAWVYCPDQTDLAPSPTAAPLGNLNVPAANTPFPATLFVRTSATGTVAARCTVATADLYAVATMGFTWARRN